MMNKILIALAALMIASCGAEKKGTTTTVKTAPTSIAGVYAPGGEELAAIQTQYTDATLEQLTTGYTIYTTGACVNCHGANSIYNFGDAQWKNILDDMAQRAKLSDKEKEAVLKYVLSVKAVQAGRQKFNFGK